MYVVVMTHIQKNGKKTDKFLYIFPSIQEKNKNNMTEYKFLSDNEYGTHNQNQSLLFYFYCIDKYVLYKTITAKKELIEPEAKKIRPL